MIGIEDQVVISAATWPALANVAPGDLLKHAPSGLGLAPPIVVQPWDDLEGVMGRGSYYGSNDRTGDPFLDAPVNEAAGGVVYFDSGFDPARLAATLALLEVYTDITDYAVFAAESESPTRDRYLAQIRIVAFGARNVFGAVPDAGDALQQQRLTAGALIDAFVSAQRTIWGSGMSAQLEGTLAGDGDWAREQLSFAFMVENSSNGVYRLWSRPWLVTK